MSDPRRQLARTLARFSGRHRDLGETLERNSASSRIGYAIGAVLLDLDEPERLIAPLSEPLLVADESEREGYVPNVMYSCGAMLHGETVVLPYGCGDSSVRVATADLGALPERLTPG
jgi:predicted GH43/DUF377 family glycosyl hydrolase